jgi:putative CocE/NonD family hydrolase
MLLTTMPAESPPPYEQIAIPMPDGTRLSARLWRPAVPETETVPAVIEWIPYRSTDATAVGDAMMHAWFAANGIAALRIDIRGSGNADGVLTDEYLAGEQDDAVAAIAWIAAQPWCNGSVGLIGISWGGFAALQIAARRPSALKAIVTACSTDDRYRDDVHYMGGCLLNDGISWGAGLFTQIARPPDPAFVGARWREMWLERLEGIAPPLGSWLAHPTRDAFWRHGSVCEDYSAITCAVMAVGGWTDGYSDAILRLMENLSVPRRALIGPWTHVYPNWGLPGPAMGFLQECLAWWRRWLTDTPEETTPETRCDLWIGQDLAPHAQSLDIGGRWTALPAWPPAPQDTLTFELGTGTLSAEKGAWDWQVAVASPEDCGLAGGEWCPLDGGGNGPEFQSDQRPDDGKSVCFDTGILEAPVEILGAPVLTLRLALATPTALVAARLCEVAADGTSGRITYGLLRLRRPADVAPGMPFDLTLPLKAVGYRFGAGKRIRLALSSAYWPIAWPEAVKSGWTLWPAESRLALPLHDPATEIALATFGPPESAEPLPHEVLRPAEVRRRVSQDLSTGESRLTVTNHRQTTKLGDLSFGGEGEEAYAIRSGDPGTASATMARETWFERPGWRVLLRTRTELRAAPDGGLALTSSLTAEENGATVFARDWHHHFSRDETP